MANSKISALTSATTPLAGTEVLPVVQSSATTQVTVANLTAGRSVSGSNFVVTSSSIPANGVYLPAANSLGIATNSTLRATFDASGNLGLKVTPNAWSSGTSFEFGNGNGLSQGYGLGPHLQINAYYNAAWKYASSSFATAIQFSAGNTNFLTAPSGITGNNITFTTVMTLSNAGGLSIGTTTDAGAGNLLMGTGNITQGTAAKGFNFSANTPLAGKTSTLLNWYEEGTWTPNQGAGLTLVGAFSSTGKYTRVGRNVTVSGTVTGATSVAVTAAGVITTNLPFTIGTAGHGNATNAANTASAAIICNTGTTVTSAGAIAATGTITFSATYFV